MNEQAVILILLIAGLTFTFYLYIWMARKEVEYKKDERWQLIQLKGCKMANISNYILVLIVAVIDTILLFNDVQITITLNRVLIYAILFISLHNTIELFSLLYLDKHS